LIGRGILLRLAALIVAYFAGAVFGITLIQQAGDVAPFWPPNALLLAVLLRSHPSRWGLWLGGAMLASFVANMLLLRAPTFGALFSFVNIIEVAISAALIRSAAGEEPVNLAERRYLVAFAALGGIVGPAVGASCAATVLAFSGAMHFGRAWFTWWVSDAMGILLFGPLFLGATRTVFERFRAIWPRAELVAVILISAAAAVGYAAIGYPLGFLVVPVLLWAAFRLEIFGCSLAAAIYATITAWLTVRGYGRMVHIEALYPADRVQYLQIALGITVLSILAVAHLVTQRERYAKRLQDSELRLRAIVDHAHDAYVAIDRNDKIAMWSPEAQRAFGWPAAEAIGRQLGETIIPPRYREDHYRGLKRYLETGEAHILNRRLELMALHRNGHEFPIELTVATFDVNEERFFSAFIRDTTERRRLEEALRERQKLEAIGRLAGGIAHTFNNLFQVIFGNLDLADRRTSDKAARDSLAKVVRAAERGALVTRQLLAFAREQTLNPQWIEPSEPLRQILSFIRQSLSDDISVAIDVPSGLWPVRIDASELQLALANLALNAHDAMPTGGNLRITAANCALEDPRLGLAGEYLIIEIVDTGGGIPKDVLPRIFDPFFSTKDPAYSRGLGLSQVHGFVSQSGGTVNVMSEPGLGTIFTLYLPASRNFQIETRHAAEPLPDAAHEVGTVLVIEDDLDVAEVTAAFLKECGFRVKIIERTEAALDLLQQDDRVDVILSDIMMPDGISGLQLAEQVRKLPHPIPVLLATGYSDAAADAASRGLPIITKPYSMEELCASVARLIPSKANGVQPA